MTSRVLNAGLAVLLVLILSTLARIASAQAPLIGANEYKAVRGASLQILKSHPPTEYFFVGVGRSPTPLIAFLKSMTGEKSAAQIAYSSASLNERLAKQYPEAATDLENYLRYSIEPLVARANGRKLLLIDYVVNGGFRYSVQVVEEYLSRHHPKQKVEFVGLVSGAHLLRNLNWMKAENIVSLDSFPAELERGMRDSSYDSVSPVGSWRLDRIEQKPAGPQAREFSDAMTAKVASDEAFPSFAGLRCKNIFAR